MLKRVCVVIHNRANYARIFSALKAIQAHPDLCLIVVVGSSAVLYRFGSLDKQIAKDGFVISGRIQTMLEGDSPAVMAKSTGLALYELAKLFEELRPDLVLTVADRFETISTAIAANFMNIPLVHTQGGEVTGSVDECVRHAISKLAHLHFPATQKAEEVLIRLGEDPANVHCVGCPAIDLIKDLPDSIPHDLISHFKGVGVNLRSEDRYLVVSQHPVTTEFGCALSQIEQTFQAVSALAEEGFKVVWLWPNIDAGSDEISKYLRTRREQGDCDNFLFVKNLSPRDYGILIKNCACLIGNSSSGIREGAFLGVPAVNIGSRQRLRERASNVMDVGYNSSSILNAARKQIKSGIFDSSDIYGDGSAGKKMAEIIAAWRPSLVKTLNYLDC